MGHNTATNVLAWTGEQAKEPHSAIASDSFFTYPGPRNWLLATPDNDCPIIAGIYGTEMGRIADEKCPRVDVVKDSLTMALSIRLHVIIREGV
jgi:hypothetical protein